MKSQGKGNISGKEHQWKCLLQNSFTFAASLVVTFAKYKVKNKPKNVLSNYASTHITHTKIFHVSFYTLNYAEEGDEEIENYLKSCR